MPKLPRLSFQRANTALLLTIIGINLYIIATPVWPLVTFWWQWHHTNRHAQLTQLTRHQSGPTTATANQPNSLIIPAMLLNQPTLESPRADWFDVLKQGIWHWPASSTPDKGGNTVFLAHRFSYTGPHGAFYYLNKLKPGDEIGVVWNNKHYTYIVDRSTEVPPTDTTVQDNTPTAQITLFTCTPLWHPINRLVVVAKLKGAV